MPSRQWPPERFRPVAAPRRVAPSNISAGRAFEYLGLPRESRAGRAEALAAGLGIAVVQGVGVDEVEHIGALLIGAGDQLAAGGEGADQRVVLVAARGRPMHLALEGQALLLGDDEGGRAVAIALRRGDAFAMAGPGAFHREVLGEGGQSGNGGCREAD